MDSPQAAKPAPEDSGNGLRQAQDFRRRFERTLFQIPEDDSYAVYQHLHHAAAELAEVDSFYACLYLPEDDSLYFAYNCDSGLYDEPVTVPMGEGPTSYVIRERKPFVLKSDNISLQNAGIPFGDPERKSRSAIHLPLRTWNADGEQILGVVSAQSYREHAFDADFLVYFTMLADRTAYELSHRMQIAAQAEENLLALRRVEAASERTRQKLDTSVVKLMKTLTAALKMAESLHPLIPPDAADLNVRVNELCRACHRAQTEATQIPLQFRPASTPNAAATDEFLEVATSDSPPAAQVRDVLSDYSLSPREREVASLLAEGLSNPMIAERLHISPDTVKFHVTGILRKLDVRNRTEVAILFAVTMRKPP